MAMTKSSGLFRTEPKNVFWAGLLVRSANGNHQGTANNRIKILLTNFAVLMVYHAKAVSIRRPQMKFTHLSVAASKEEVTNSTPTIQKSLISRPVKTELGLASRQHDPIFNNIEIKPVSLQVWK